MFSVVAWGVYCELNHIEYFWCHSKRYARENCDYTIEGLRENVPTALACVSNRTISACFNSCLRKMDFTRTCIGEDIHTGLLNGNSSHHIRKCISLVMIVNSRGCTKIDWHECNIRWCSRSDLVSCCKLLLSRLLATHGPQQIQSFTIVSCSRFSC